MTQVILRALSLCETRAGNLAHAVGRLAFRPGRPMLVEHVGGLFLEHAMTGRVLTHGYPDDFDITFVHEDEAVDEEIKTSPAPAVRRVAQTIMGGQAEDAQGRHKPAYQNYRAHIAASDDEDDFCWASFP